MIETPSGALPVQLKDAAGTVVVVGGAVVVVVVAPALLVRAGYSPSRERAWSSSPTPSRGPCSAAARCHDDDHEDDPAAIQNKGRL